MYKKAAPAHNESEMTYDHMGGAFLKQQFLADYLEHIIPVSFLLSSEGEIIKLGKDAPRFTVTLNHELDKKELLASTSLALGEAYMRGDLEVDKDLFEVLDAFMGQMDRFTTNHSLLRRLLYTSTSRKNQKKEVSSHYDIGNDFYSLWLDETMSYSCGYFRKEEDTLYEAQVQKVDHILEKLQLKPGMTLLDIGCGWGFLLKRAVEKYDVRGMGITLSREQAKKAGEDIRQEGLEEKIRIQVLDYRELKHTKYQFDRVVSVGMLEHVGRDNYPLYLENVKSVLKPGGLFLLHFISALKEYPGDPFMKKYIFPGGMVPSLREIIQLMGDMQLYTLDVESLRRHYSKTLLCWRENFLEHREEILKMQGIEFTRMWELYLTACAATFKNGVIDLHQILMSNGVNNELPMTRVV